MRIGQRGILIDLLHIQCQNGQGRLGALSHGGAHEVDVTLLAAHPHTGDQLGREPHEPAIAVEVGGARLAAHLGGDVVLRAQAASRARVHHAHEHVEHFIIGVLAHDFGLLASELGKDVTLVVANACDIDRLDAHATVGKRRVGRHHLAQGDFAHPQAQSRHGLQVAGDAKAVHPLGQLAGWVHGVALLLNPVGRGALHEAGRNGVDRGGESRLECHRAASATRVPHLAVPVDVWSAAGAHRARRATVVVHSLGIDKRLDRGANLPAPFRHHVVLEEAEVGASHVGFHISGDRIHRHHGASQERLGVEQRVARGHGGFVVAVVTEQAHRGGRVEIAHNLLLALALLLEHTIAVGALDGIVDQRLLGRCREFGPVVGVGVLGATTLAQERWLERLAHVLAHGLLGIGLHALVDGGVDFQSVAVDVVVRAIGLGVLVAPAVEWVAHPGGRVVHVGLAVPLGVVLLLGLLGHHHAAQLLAEVGRQAVVVVHAVIAEHQGELLGGLGVGLAQETGLDHLVKHHIASLAGALAVAQRIVVRRVFAHAHQRGRFLQVELRGVFAEIDKCRRLDAHSVVQEVELVEIHLDNLVLGVVALELDGDDPLDGFLQGTLKDVARFGRVELLGELLGDGAATAGALLAHQHALDNRAPERPHVDTRMVVEAGVFGGNQCVAQVLRELVVVHIDAVSLAAVEASHFFAPGGVDGRGELVGGIAQLLNGRHIANHAVINQDKQQGHQTHKGAKGVPHALHDARIACLPRGTTLGVVAHDFSEK